MNNLVLEGLRYSLVVEITFLTWAEYSEGFESGADWGNEAMDDDLFKTMTAVSEVRCRTKRLVDDSFSARVKLARELAMLDEEYSMFKQGGGTVYGEW